MKASEAITQADALRPNTISTDQKILWLYELEADLSELMMIWEAPLPGNYPTDDPDLLMPKGHDQIYVLYLMAMIDNGNEETSLYANDFANFNQAYLEARQWWVRTHRPRKPTRITGLL